MCQRWMFEKQISCWILALMGRLCVGHKSVEWADLDFMQKATKGQILTFSWVAEPTIQSLLRKTDFSW